MSPDRNNEMRRLPLLVRRGIDGLAVVIVFAALCLTGELSVTWGVGRQAAGNSLLVAGVLAVLLGVARIVDRWNIVVQAWHYYRIGVSACLFGVLYLLDMPLRWGPRIGPWWPLTSLCGVAAAIYVVSLHATITLADSVLLDSANFVNESRLAPSDAPRAYALMERIGGIRTLPALYPGLVHVRTALRALYPNDVPMHRQTMSDSDVAAALVALSAVPVDEHTVDGILVGLLRLKILTRYSHDGDNFSKVLEAREYLSGFHPRPADNVEDGSVAVVANLEQGLYDNLLGNNAVMCASRYDDYSKWALTHEVPTLSVCQLLETGAKRFQTGLHSTSTLSRARAVNNLADLLKRKLTFATPPSHDGAAELGKDLACVSDAFATGEEQLRASTQQLISAVETFPSAGMAVTVIQLSHLRIHAILGRLVSQPRPAPEKRRTLLEELRTVYRTEAQYLARALSFGYSQADVKSDAHQWGLCADLSPPERIRLLKPERDELDHLTDELSSALEIGDASFRCEVCGVDSHSAHERHARSEIGK